MKISIITVNYNDKKGLEKTINSVVNQSFTDIEFLVIDGNSSDGSKEIIEKYKSKINYWVSEPDLGIYNAMNKGIKAAKGEFIIFMNAGDSFFDDDVLSKSNPLLNSNIGIYYGNLIFKLNEKQTKLCRPPSELSFSYFVDFSLPHQATFIKKELFSYYFFYNETLKIMSDWEFNIFCICKQNVSYKHLDLIIANFDNSGVSSNPENLNKIAYERDIVFKNHFPLFYEDSKKLNLINSKRFLQIIDLKKNKFQWKLLKAFMNLLSLFKPKTETFFSKYFKDF